MREDNPKDLAAFRLDQAAECLQSTERNIADGLFKSAANRSYYCIFHSMRAVLALDRFDAKSHGNVIGQFRKDYIKTGIFAAKYSDVIKDAFEVRNDSDYQDFYVISKEDVYTQLENARDFLSAVKEYVSNRLKTEN